MINTNNLKVISIKNNCAKIKSAINTFILSLAVLSVVYFIYWCGVMSDDIILQYTEQIFKPLASFLCAGDTSIEIYRKTGVILFLSIFPAFFSHYLVSKYEEGLINSAKLQEEKKKQKEIKKAHEENLAQYDIIKNYSICLSVDLSTEQKLAKENEEILYKIVYNKIKKLLEELKAGIKIYLSDVLIITSNNFENYDMVYDTVLKILSYVKKNTENKYGVQFSASLTTDASNDGKTTNAIRKNHFEIQSFNFKNRALTTAIFAKKYKHLNHKKYAGIPIGEYVSVNNDKMDTYELNVVFKNLTNTLSKI